ncbi:toxin 37 [Desulforamulus aeronauticus DSM 10349]|uniref:Toxin 37 n=1 Tax=Desulforamulus aeronauticus DSM 10349 TaxID=1121421 RepID=A0A1M6XEQ1_9FIRM|nr:toxin 37 [Desulforamulus aeronauticus DSM 10349]
MNLYTYVENDPFKGKTATEIDQMFRAKGFELRGLDPLTGKGGYVNPKIGHSYHIDEVNSFGEFPHVDVNRKEVTKAPLIRKNMTWDVVFDDFNG